MSQRIVPFIGYEDAATAIEWLGQFDGDAVRREAEANVLRPEQGRVLVGQRCVSQNRLHDAGAVVGRVGIIGANRFLDVTERRLGRGHPDFIFNIITDVTVLKIGAFVEVPLIVTNYRDAVAVAGHLVDIGLFRAATVMPHANRIADPIEQLRRFTHAPEDPSDQRKCVNFYRW